MFLGLPEPGLAGARDPPKPGRLLDEPAGQPPPGHLLALARAQPATAAGGHWGGGRGPGALAQLLRSGPAPPVSARGGAGRRRRPPEGGAEGLGWRGGAYGGGGVCGRGGSSDPRVGQGLDRLA